MVQEQVCSALCSLGELRPAEMLRTCEEYLKQHDKVLPVMPVTNLGGDGQLEAEGGWCQASLLAQLPTCNLWSSLSCCLWTVTASLMN